MRNMGEACTAANRFYVHGRVAAEFAERLAERMGALAVGPGTEPGVDVGPLIDADGRGKVAALVADAVERGAQGRSSAARPPRAPGTSTRRPCWPTCTADATLMRERDLRPGRRRSLTFDDEDEVVAAANDTEWGLVAYVFTRDLNRALRVSERLEAAWSGSTQGWCPTRPRPSAASSSPGSAVRAAARASRSSWRTKYVAIPY